MFEIKTPRYHDNTIMLGVHKLDRSKKRNVIKIFSDTAKRGYYTCDTEKIEGCPIESNGEIDCYVVPMDLLEFKAPLNWR